MNSVNLTGNLAVDPELKQTKSGKDVCTIRVAVSRIGKNDEGRYESDFFSVQCWDQTARFVSTYLKKGDKIAVSGEMRERNYTAQDGSKRYTVEVVASRVESLERRDRGGEAEAPAAKGNDRRGFVEVVDDDLPF